MHKEIAQWMYDKIIKDGAAYQAEIVHEIVEKFGEDYTYYNDNGNLAIDTKITAHFRKINSDKKIQWDREEFRWLYLGDKDEQERIEGLIDKL